ncbi:MAG: 2-amino-4-hydroxy-6-hydroxymethyldihydropteridine diphosphokinase [Tannerella sp.]|nr:2-amino-4-hydroxy-6-hydroxymethyldihydropteridine diphosphokinase [Tannerella sp.]
MSEVFLGLGSNIGNRRGNMEKALALIAGRVGVVLSLSGFYETPPWGYESAETYLNAVVLVDTGLSPSGVLSAIQTIEKDVGRTEKTVNGEYHDRIIDIDILLYDRLILQTPELTVPHPLMLRRQFVMQPLSEIAPDMIHPVSGKTMAEHYICSELPSRGGMHL